MSRLPRRLIALMVIPLLVSMSGCMRLKADYEILGNDQVKILMDIGMQNQTLQQMGQEAPDFCEQAGTMGGPITEVDYADEGPDGYTGCRIEGTAPLSEVNNSSTTLVLDEDLWTFHMVGDDGGGAEGLTADMFSDFEVRVTFPGTVVSSNGTSTVEGSTVIWTSPTDLFTEEGLLATGENDGAAALPWLWIVIGGIVLIGAVIAVALVLGRQRATPVSPQGSPFQNGQAYPPQGPPFQNAQKYAPQSPPFQSGQPYPPQGPPFQSNQPYPPHDSGER